MTSNTISKAAAGTSAGTSPVTAANPALIACDKSSTTTTKAATDPSTDKDGRVRKPNETASAMSREDATQVRNDDPLFLASLDNILLAAKDAPQFVNSIRETLAARTNDSSDVRAQRPVGNSAAPDASDVSLSAAKEPPREPAALRRGSSAVAARATKRPGSSTSPNEPNRRRGGSKRRRVGKQAVKGRSGHR